ncbi:MAG: triose-phosphate isomerase [Planctomycetota bacterium JB042]
MRKPFVAGNWKMNLDGAAARPLVEGLAEACDGVAVEVGVFPPFPLLERVARWAEGSSLIVGAQDCHDQASGAYTGEVSAAMVGDAGGTHVILGHSERRQQFHEDEPLLARKLRAALEHGLAPILCVGESLEQRDGGRTLDVCRGQLEGGLEPFSADDLSTLTVAYEPVWAIGTGRTATPDQAVEVHRALRETLAGRFGKPFADAVRIQYGGSVKADNAASLLGEAEIDGALVGGASLKLDAFLPIVRAGESLRSDP